MRFLRRFLFVLALVIALAALLVAAAFNPTVQTWIAQATLDRHPDLHASLGSLAAGTGDLEAHDLTLAVNGATLTLPSLQALLPLKRAVWEKKIEIHRLIAKGWTLDLSNATATTIKPPLPPAQPASTAAPTTPPLAPANSALQTTLLFHQLLAGWTFPPEVTIDEVDLEGDLLIPAGPGRDPTGVHVIVKGGRLGAGREGAFTIETSIPIEEHGRSAADLLVHGRLVVALDAGRAPQRLALTADLAAKGRPLPDGLSATVVLTAADAAHDETYIITLNRSERPLATVAARLPATTRAPAGTWKIDLRDSDLAPFFPQKNLPAVATTGAGEFETDAAFTRVRATGHLVTVASRLGELATPLDRLGTVTLTTDFSATHSSNTLRFDRLNASLAGAQPAVIAQALQPFTVDETTGDLRVADAQADWLAGSLPGLPLAWIFGSPDGLNTSGGEVTGDFIAHAGADGITLRAKAPLTALGVAVRRGEKILGRDLDLSLAFLAKISPQGWQVQAAPLILACAGQHLATIEATAAQPADGGKPIKLSGEWTADLIALAAQPALAALGGHAGRTASGEFTVLTGSWLNAENKFTVVGRDPTHTLGGSLHVNADPNGRATFFAPIKIALGTNRSEFSAEGNWASPAKGGRLVLNLTGERVTLTHLALVAAPLTAVGRSTGPELSVTANARDSVPFWGDWVGRVGLDFGRMTAWGHNFLNVGGTLFLDHGAIKLEGGRGAFHQDRLMRAEGAVTFDAAAESPYTTNATATVEDLDAAILIGPPPRGREPLLRGHFAVAATLTGDGRTLADLSRRTREEFRLTSLGNGGSTTLLQAKVANSITEAPTPVKDALGTVGSVFGTLMKTKSNILQTEKNPLGKNTEAILNFTYATAEFRYEHLAFTAIRAADGSLLLVDVVLSAPNERVTGSGQVAAAKICSFGERPLSLDLQFGFRGHPAELLTEAGVLSTQKDADGYTLLNQRVHFGGTATQLDSTEWRELLVKAAAPLKPEPAKKSN